MTTETALDIPAAERSRRAFGPQDDGRKMSAQEFAAAEFSEPHRYERAKGRLVVMPPDGKDHSIASFHSHARLGRFALEHPDLVPFVATPCWIRLDDETDRIADFGVYLRPDVGPPDPPDLVFEVVSPGKVNRDRDYIHKKAEYRRLGIPEYVIIDRLQRSITVCRLREGSEVYEELVLTEADVYESPLLPGFALAATQSFGN